VLLARELLTAPAATALSAAFAPAQRQRWLRLRGELFGLLGETEQSLAAYTELADGLADAGARAEVEQAIWGVLRQTPTEALRKLARDTADPRVHGWYQLARVHVDRHEPEEARKIIQHLHRFEPKVAAQLERETGLLVEQPG